MPEFWSAVLALGFYTASRVAEQVRFWVESIGVEQMTVQFPKTMVSLCLIPAGRPVCTPKGAELPAAAAASLAFGAVWASAERGMALIRQNDARAASA